MSLKSFDKFCETLITAEPGSQKIILDERQRQVSSKLTTEALLIYIVASSANTVFMDKLYRWCDGFFAPMVLFASVCYIYWILRRHFCGVLFGINGTTPGKWSAAIFVIQPICWCIALFSHFAAEETVFIHDGMLAEELVYGIAFILVFISSVVVLICAKKTEKAEQPDEEKKG